MAFKAILVTILSVFFCELASASEWSDPVEVRHRITPVVTYRAQIDGDLLVVQVKHATGWHTYAMDNVLRAQKRRGKIFLRPNSLR